LALGHSAYIFASPDLGFFSFAGLHHVHASGFSGAHYWMYMQPDAAVASPDHWLRSATQAEKLAHVQLAVTKMPAKFQEIFQLTKPDGIKKDPHIWQDLELDSLPACRVVLVGDAAHAMTPFRGEGGYHTLIDALKLSKTLVQLRDAESGGEIGAVKAAVAEYNAEMLARGGEAVRSSRNVQQAKKKTKTGDGEKPKLVSANQVARLLPEEEIVLEVKARVRIVQQAEEGDGVGVKAEEQQQQQPMAPEVATAPAFPEVKMVPAVQTTPALPVLETTPAVSEVVSTA
ncbi:MAG: hypothetical protein Q9210_007657, partial [Variospora velana]